MSRARQAAGRGLGALALVALLAAGQHRAEAQARTAALVRGKIDQVLAVLRDPSLRGRARRAERHDRILAVANTIFDWDEFARRCLGATWRQIDAGQRQRFVGLFRQLLAGYYLEQMDNFAGDEKISVQGASGGGDQQVVKTLLVTRSRERMPIDYLLEKGPAGWRVVDVSVEQISLVNNYRSRFRSYLVNRSFEELLAHLSRVVGRRKSQP